MPSYEGLSRVSVNNPLPCPAPIKCICFKFYRNVPAALNRACLVSAMQAKVCLFEVLEEAMFLVVRSVFWLTVAYMVIKPGVDFADAQAVSAQAMAAGQQVIAQQIQAIDCDSFQCVGGKAVIAAALRSSPPVGTPMHESPTIRQAPIPRPRPDWAG